ncbi:MAG: T9SS type A sorting domain-containing protein [Bacteroidia bacterium]|nr:T9SS type A sorting domain-containing protein [Bacteroidia bacterium]
MDTSSAAVTYQTSIISAQACTFVRIYPNPSTGTFEVDFTSAEKGDFTIKLINIAGQVIYKDNFIKDKVSFKKTFVLPDLSIGVYQLQLESGMNLFNSLLIITR